MSKPDEPDGLARCGRCKIELQPAGSNGALACSSCGGEFCERATLEALVQDARLAASTRGYVRPRLSLADPVRYVACPVCGELMLRRNFGDASGVVVDVCTRHGVWFDRGELVQVLEFCASGALDRARAEAAERADASRRMRDFQSRLQPVASNNEAPSVDGLDVMDAVSLCVELIRLFRPG